MEKRWAADRGRSFYLGFGIIGLLIVLCGFGVTYGLPMARGTFSAPWYVHLHGAAALGWVLLFIAQASLVVCGRSPLHRRLGGSAIPIAAAIWASGVATSAWAAERDLPAFGSVATSAIVGTLTGLGFYFFIVLGAIALRRRPDWHKRLMMLATIQLLWPAFFRLRHLLPLIPKPEISLALVVAYSPIAVAAIRDHRQFGAIHPVWLFVAPLLFLEQCVELAIFDQGWHRTLGEALFSLLSQGGR